MSQRITLTAAQHEAIYREKLDGHTLKETAHNHHCSEGCARKWWRIGRDHGLAGLRQTRDARSAPGVLSSFEPIAAERALALKQQHPRRGAVRILHDLGNDAQVTGLALPKHSSLAEFFHQKCPELLLSYHRQPAPPPQARHRA